MARAGTLVWAVLAVALAAPTSAARADWVDIGPPGGGNAWPIAVDPVDARTAYVAGDWLHLFKTSDAGRHWRELESALGGIVMALAATPSGIYAGKLGGSGEYVCGRFPQLCTTAQSLERSTDGGATWVPLYREERAGEHYFGRFLVVDAPSTGRIRMAGFDGILASDDAGTTWRVVPPGPLSPPDLAAWVYDPASPSTVYVGQSAGATGSRGGVFKSVDGGETFAPASNGLVADADADVRAVAIDPSAPSTLYAATGGGVFRSTDAGGTWQRFSGADLPGPVTDVAVDPRAPRRLLAGVLVEGKSGVFASEDGGGWTATQHPEAPNAYTPVAVAFAPSAPETVYATLPGRCVMTSLDAGDVWRAGGCVPKDIGAVAVAPRNPAAIVALSGEFAERSTDGGGAWSVSQLPGGPAWAVAIPSDPGRFVYVAFNCSLGTSADGGVTWELRFGPDPLSCAVQLTADPFTPTTVYAATERGDLWKSEDTAVTWTPLRDGTRSLGPGILVSPSTPGLVYASAHDPPFVLRSRDAGRTWEPADAGIAAQPLRLAADPNDEARLYAWSAVSATLHASVDAGDSWSLASSGAPFLLGVDALTSDLYGVVDAAFGASQLQIAAPGGATWRDFGPGLPAGTGFDSGGAVLDPASCAIYAFGDGGLHRLALHQCDPQTPTLQRVRVAVRTGRRGTVAVRARLVPPGAIEAFRGVEAIALEVTDSGTMRHRGVWSQADCRIRRQKMRCARGRDRLSLARVRSTDRLRATLSASPGSPLPQGVLAVALAAIGTDAGHRGQAAVCRRGPRRASCH